MAEKEEIKQVSKKKKGRPKKTILKATPKPVPTKRVRNPRNDLKVQETTMNFKAWFVNELTHDKRLKEHHYEQLKMFMTSMGLKETEAAWKYKAGLKTYFGD